jgi:orotidine-5'-phosphate decarboxylase
MTVFEARDRLILAIDVDDVVSALRLARRMRPWFATAKVGLELFSAAGPETVAALVVEGYRVFLDLKLHDIPTTVNKTARVLGGLGATYTTVHTVGGVVMLKAAVEGMAAGAASAGAPQPCVLGVTVLTSESDASSAVLADRASMAAEAGCGGLVCAAGDLPTVRKAAPGLLTVVPGIRPSGVEAHDQGRAATPTYALNNGADLLVVGRAVTAASDPEAAAQAIHDEMAAAVPPSA